MDIAEISKELEWLDALKDYEKGNGAPLAALLRSGSAMPAAVSVELASYVEGSRRVCSKNADKRLLSEGRKRELAGRWQSAQRMLKRFRVDAKWVADEKGMEPADVLKTIKGWRQSVLDDLAAEYGVSAEVVRKAK